MLIQLNPTIPVWVEGRGNGHAIGWMDYSQEHQLMWIIAMDDNGEIWTISNPKVRLYKNISMERIPNNE
jgi:hypothetical protein